MVSFWVDGPTCDVSTSNMCSSRYSTYPCAVMKSRVYWGWLVGRVDHCSMQEIQSAFLACLWMLSLLGLNAKPSVRAGSVLQYVPTYPQHFSFDSTCLIFSPMVSQNWTRCNHSTIMFFRNRCEPEREPFIPSGVIWYTLPLLSRGWFYDVPE